ncbi:hypothetical protein GGR57DRAFT_456449 [Xylariaceae sp. FL1272]|nr:hypothetical protein GGR57DRAFT_456449 [Xylariaceae sp. FL1272]
MVQVTPIRVGLKRSRYVPKDLEIDLCLNAVLTENINDEDVPHIIVLNCHTGCMGQYYLLRSGGAQFIFHHDQQCDCWLGGEPKKPLLQLPEPLDEFRLDLLRGRNVPYRMESRFAAIMVMKLFLGMEVPPELTPRKASNVNVPETIAEESEKPSESEEAADQVEDD